MPSIAVLNMQGQEVGQQELSEAVFGIEPNVSVMNDMVKNYLANQRQGTQSALTRSEVSGGGKKPWRQKGTGRARQGTIRAPQWAGGGTVFGPHPRSYEMKVNKKEIKLAMRSALSAKLADNQLMVVADWNFEKPCTKDAVAALKALGIEGRATLVIGNEDINTYKSFRNIPTVTIVPVCMINTYDFLDNKTLVLTESTLARIEEVLA